MGIVNNNMSNQATLLIFSNSLNIVQVSQNNAFYAMTINYSYWIEWDVDLLADTLVLYDTIWKFFHVFDSRPYHLSY
jgi:hypothetical protein